jgi:hypothetical protein
MLLTPIPLPEVNTLEPTAKDEGCRISGTFGAGAESALGLVEGEKNPSIAGILGFRGVLSFVGE